MKITEGKGDKRVLMPAAPALQQTHGGLRTDELDPNDTSQLNPLNRTVR